MGQLFPKPYGRNPYIRDDCPDPDGGCIPVVVYGLHWIAARYGWPKGPVNAIELVGDGTAGNALDIGSLTTIQGTGITFNGGTHQEAIRMRYEDWLRIAEPQVIPFARHD